MQNETVIRLVFFLGIFILIAFWEMAVAKRRLTVSKTERWVNNIGIILFDSVLVKILFPIAAMGVAAAANQNDWGVLNFFNVPFFPAVIIGVLFLDMIIYLQHLMFHAVPAFWRLHMMHHADLDIDVTTALRFHPIEILLSMGIKMAVVAALGPPVVAVLLFEIILNGTAMFNHGNIRLPGKLDRFLRLLVVTPDMHRVHHSVLIRETNSNFGFNFPWWDRLFGTYRDQPIAGHEGMTIGLAQFRQPKALRLHKLLLLPFVGNPGHYSLNSIGRDPEVLLKKKKV